MKDITHAVASHSIKGEEACGIHCFALCKQPSFSETT